MTLSKFFHGYGQSSHFAPIAAFIGHRARYGILFAFAFFQPVMAHGALKSPCPVPTTTASEILQIGIAYKNLDTIRLDDDLSIDAIGNFIEVSAPLARQGEPVVEVGRDQHADQEADRSTDAGADGDDLKIVNYIRDHGWLHVFKLGLMLALFLFPSVVAASMGSAIGMMIGEGTARKAIRARRVEKITRIHNERGTPVESIIRHYYGFEKDGYLERHFGIAEGRKDEQL